MRWQSEGGFYRDRCACVYMASIISLFVYMCVHCIYIAVDPLPILRVAFIGVNWQKLVAIFHMLA